MTGVEELSFGPPTDGGPALTHRLFRYPAKFHAPVARALLETYSRPGQTVLDPFVGSGTLLVEARVLGRSAVGADVDPVAVLVADVKSHRHDPATLRDSLNAVETAFNRHERSHDEYERRMHVDLTAEEYAKELAEVREWVPAIPHLTHWFRHYVIIDLARIRRIIELSDLEESHRNFLRVVFASTIRNASNADPVPVSGLEVTAYMKKRDAAGRLVNPFQLFRVASARAWKGAAAYWSESDSSTHVQVIQADATRLSTSLPVPVDAVITSPPYHGAVDYYRRHQLEMYWLGLTTSHADRLALLNDYIGRPKVPQSHPLVSQTPLRTALAKEWEQRIRSVSRERADAFHHYIAAMSQVFEELARCTRPGSPVVLVVGHSAWNSSEIPTTGLFEELAGQAYNLNRVLSYAVKNRYMSYSRRNGANIDREYVLEFLRA